MALWFAITLYVALMSAPAGLDKFAISLQDEKKTLEFTRQVDGTWRCQQAPVRPENPRDESGFVRLAGTTLVMIAPANDRGPAKEVKMDVAEWLELAPPVDWTKVEKLTLKNKAGGGPVVLKREGDTVILSQEEPVLFRKPAVIRWEKKP
jgi:hypothetical protein